MKYAVLVGDGMADYPVRELGNKTPLESAKTPNMDFAAKNGRSGLVKTVPAGFAPASDVANLSIIGYDPKKYYSGRGPLEASNMGIKLGPDDVAFRCNLFTIDNGLMADYSAGHITTGEASTLIRFLDKEMGSDKIRFYPGVSYRHLMIVKDASLKEALLKSECVPPHDITGSPIKWHLQNGAGGEFLVKIMEDSRALLSGHEVNHVRIDLRENPANMVWLWGQGVDANMPKFRDLYGADGSVISAVDLIKGIGKTIGLDVIDVPGATGYYDTNYQGKAQYAIDSLKHKDFVFVHVEAPDEAGHNGDLRAKIAAIESFDRFVVGAFLGSPQGKKGELRVMVLPDHFTPVSLRTHSAEPVPFVMCGKGIEPNNAPAFSEAEARNTGLMHGHGEELMRYFMKP